MIVLEKQDFSPKEDREIREWLNHPSAELFIRALASEIADEQIQLMRVFEKQSVDLCLGGPIPVSALPKIRQAATLQTLITLLRKKMQKDQPLFYVTTTIE